jgi:hypothetical protein
VFVGLLSTRGCNIEDQCLSQECTASAREGKTEVGRTRCRISRAARSLQAFQLGVQGTKAVSEGDGQQPEKGTVVTVHLWSGRFEKSASTEDE